MFNLKKVDFIWINRDQKSFEWFVNLLSQLEAEQQEHGGELGRFLEMHMYMKMKMMKMMKMKMSSAGSSRCTCTSPPPSNAPT